MSKLWLSFVKQLFWRKSYRSARGGKKINPGHFFFFLFAILNNQLFHYENTDCNKLIRRRSKWRLWYFEIPTIKRNTQVLLNRLLCVLCRFQTKSNTRALRIIMLLEVYCWTDVFSRQNINKYYYRILLFLSSTLLRIV